MSTTFPDSIQTFPTMLDMSATDGTLVKQYQDARNANNIALANQILAQIPNVNQKLWSADIANTLTDTNVALQEYYVKRYSPAYVVSVTQPIAQALGDYWIKVL